MQEHFDYLEMLAINAPHQTRLELDTVVWEDAEEQSIFIRVDFNFSTLGVLEL